MPEEITEDSVRKLYESFPYPLRNPSDEKNRMVVRGPEYLCQINHFVFGGRQSFGSGSRILVAGGGTGDETVFFAEQLRHRGGAVAYLDQSEASMTIARQRVATRGLTNVEFYLGKIEDLSTQIHGTFDFIQSIGVLHHMQSPEIGLSKLKAVLRQGGGMGLFLYAPHGRRGNYQLQDLAKLAFDADQSLENKVPEMIKFIASLPPDHPFFRGGDPKETLQGISEDPNELVDSLLHSRDRAFTVGEIYDLLEGAGINLVEFIPFRVHDGASTCFTLYYDPSSYITDTALVTRLSKLSIRKRNEIAELLNGKMDNHCFYASTISNSEAQIESEGMVPFFIPKRSCFNFIDNKLVMTDHGGSRYKLPISPTQKILFELIDGVRDFDQILQEGKKVIQDFGMPEVELCVPLKDLYLTLRKFNWIALRHSAVQPFENYDHMYWIS
jgi:SAM-dependent methyltransferase